MINGELTIKTGFSLRLSLPQNNGWYSNTNYRADEPDYSDVPF